MVLANLLANGDRYGDYKRCEYGEGMFNKTKNIYMKETLKDDFGRKRNYNGQWRKICWDF